MAKRARPAAVAGRDRLDTLGTAAIEFALASPVLVLLMVGGFDLGRALYEQHRLAAAARAGAQYAIQRSTTWTDSTGIAQAARNDAGDTSGQLGVASGTCTCPTGATLCSTSASCTGSTVAGTYVTITVSESFATVATYPFVASPLALSSQAIIRVQ